MRISVIRPIAPSPSRIAQNNNSCPNLHRKVTKTNQFAPPRTSLAVKAGDRDSSQLLDSVDVCPVVALLALLMSACLKDMD